MPNLLTVTMDTRQLKRAMADLKTKAPVAIARALNRTVSSAKALAVKLVAKDIGVTQKTVRPNIMAVKAYPTKLLAELWASARAKDIGVARYKSEKRGRIPIYGLKAKGPIPSRGKGKGVTYKLAGGRGVAPHAFIATVKAGKHGSTHTGVFQRIPGTQMRSARKTLRGELIKREMIAELYGPSIPWVFFKRAILHAMVQSAKENLSKYMKHEVEHLLSKKG
jgi:uncharacterized protein YlxP (DUF503 family)